MIHLFNVFLPSAANNSALKKFLEATSGMSPAERAKELEQNKVFIDHWATQSMWFPTFSFFFLLLARNLDFELLRSSCD